MLTFLCSTSFAIGQDELVRDSTPASWQEDAELTDVFFINPKTGWTVGAQGTILRTTNGGQDWFELGHADLDQVAPVMGLQEKIRAMQQGQRTQLTGVADGSSEQALPFRCRFESVFFIDEKNGWVAGGYEVPYIDHSRGIILRTADGGVTWRQVRGALLPAIKRIRFSDPKNGWAVGDRGSLLPGSLFYTSDGGETWSNQTIQRERSGPFDFIDADATDKGFAAINAGGHPVVAKNGQIEPAVFECGNVARLNRIKMVDRQTGWCVGDAGTVLRTQNGCVSWNALTEDSNSPIYQQLKQFDWQTIAVSTSKIWFAGNPGSMLLSIDRKTGDVLSHSTGESLPVAALHFVDDQHGWAVGSLGMILSTTDGGQTWHRQRGRQRGLAVLGVSFDETELPFEALALYGSDENLLVAAVTCEGKLSLSAKQAAERLGGVGLFSAAAYQPQATPEQKQEEQLERLVRLIRTLRPNVLLCNSEYQKPAGDGASPGSAFDPYLMVSTAVRAAGDRESFPQQIEIAKLEPWSVDRVAYRAPAGDLNLDSNRMLLQFGCSIEDRIGISRGLLRMPMATGRKTSYLLESGTGVRISGTSSLFNGLNRGGAGQIPKRSSDTRLRTHRASIELANRKQDKIAELSQFMANTEQDLIVWNQKIQDWLAPIDEPLAGIWLAQLAEKYLERGQIELCAKSLEYQVRRYQGHALCLASLTWLVNYYSSDEFGRLELANLSRYRRTLAQTGNGVQPGARIGQPSARQHLSHQDGQTILVWAPVSDKIELPQRPDSAVFDDASTEANDPKVESDVAQPDPGVEVASHTETVYGFSADEIQAFHQSRWRRANTFMTQINHVDPDLVNRLSYRYLQANLTRKLVGSSSAHALLKRIESDKEQSGLSAAARAELELKEDVEIPVLPIDTIRAPLTTQRPRLDGSLGDEVWLAIQSHQLEFKQTAGEPAVRPRGWSEVAPQPKQDVLMFAHDDQFLYVAIRCNKRAGQFYQMSPDSRPRDPDLTRRDRVELHFDVDRDHQSAFKFTIDYRGWGAEELNGAIGWNPQWFIARSEDEESWTVEFAIPMEVFSEAQNSGNEATQPGRVASMEKAIWRLRLARITSDMNLWNQAAQQLEKSELSKGLYQQILIDPAKFQFFAFR